MRGRSASVSHAVSPIGALFVSAGDVNTLKELSSCASAFRESDSRGHLPLHTAALQPHQDVLRAVLDGEGRLGRTTVEHLLCDGRFIIT